MRTHCDHAGVPEMRELLEWCPMGGKQIFPGTLPALTRTIRSVNTSVIAGRSDEVELG
ncbi:hypothetical protein BC826DRAFT_1036667, partial [Russula brevipes]